MRELARVKRYFEKLEDTHPIVQYLNTFQANVDKVIACAIGGAYPLGISQEDYMEALTQILELAGKLHMMGLTLHPLPQFRE